MAQPQACIVVAGIARCAAVKPTGLTLLLLSFAAAVVHAAPHSALDPRPRDNRWMERHDLINERVAEAGAKSQVIFIGDSITQGWEGAGREVWERYYSPRHALNLGIGGDRTQHVLWRLENGNLKGLNPKAAVVMIGTNNSNGEDNTVEQIADGVTAIVRKLRQAVPGTKVVLLGIFPRSENPTPQRGKLLMVNQIISKLAEDPMVVWVDFGHRFIDAQGLIPGDLMPDYLHLSPAGYEIWAEAIEPTLVEILEGHAATTLSGAWTWTTTGPDGQPVSSPLELRQTGTTVQGRFHRDATRWLEIRDGKVEGNRFSWTVTRDRPGGGMMTYQMSGTFTDTSIDGEATTTMDGSQVTIEWSAERDNP